MDILRLDKKRGKKYEFKLDSQIKRRKEGCPKGYFSSKHVLLGCMTKYFFGKNVEILYVAFSPEV